MEHQDQHLEDILQVEVEEMKKLDQQEVVQVEQVVVELVVVFLVLVLKQMVIQEQLIQVVEEVEEILPHQLEVALAVQE